MRTSRRWFSEYLTADKVVLKPQRVVPCRHGMPQDIGSAFDTGVVLTCECEGARR